MKMSGEARPFNKGVLNNIGYGVIKIKYFIMIVIALLLEIITLTVYLLNNEKIIEFDLFNAGILYGGTSIVIVVLAIGSLVIMKLDKSRDKKKIYYLLGFKRNYQKLVNKYSKEIDGFVKGFDSERNDIDLKINYAIALEEVYDSFSKEFSKIKISNFLNSAHKYESDHIAKEKLFYCKFSSFSRPDELKKISSESSLAHKNFEMEIDWLEKSLKLMI